MKPQLAVIRGCTKTTEDNGRIVEIIQRVPAHQIWIAPDGNSHAGDGPCFAVKSMGSNFLRKYRNSNGEVLSEFCLFLERVVFPINDNPGNESWFTAAPRSKPATTKQDTINERGELA